MSPRLSSGEIVSLDESLSAASLSRPVSYELLFSRLNDELQVAKLSAFSELVVVVKLERWKESSLHWWNEIEVVVVVGVRSFDAVL